MKAFHAFLVLFLICFTVSCGTIYGVQYNYDKQVDFESLKTYDWMTVPEKAAIDSPNFERVKKAVNTELQAKGLMITSNNPDFLIAQHLGKKGKEQVLAGGGRNSAYKYEEGSLILDFVDAKSKEIIWRGVVKAEVTYADTPEKKEKLVNEAIQKILEKFPPKSK